MSALQYILCIFSIWLCFQYFAIFTFLSEFFTNFAIVLPNDIIFAGTWLLTMWHELVGHSGRVIILKHSEKPAKHHIDETMSKQTSVYLLSEEVEHFKDKHLTPYVEKWGKGGLKMDLNLRPPSVWSVTLTFSASTIINNASNDIGRNIKAYKSLNTSVFCINMGNNPSHWNCSHWIRHLPDFCYIWCWHVSVHYSLYCQWSSFEINGGDTEVSCRGCSLFSVSVSCCN